MTRSLAAALFVAFLFVLAPGQATAQVKLAQDWDEAFEEATRRNIPVLFFLGREGKTPWVQMFKVPAIAAYLNDRVVVVIGHRGGAHAPDDVVDPKTKEKTLVCPVYGPELFCAVHKAFFDDHAGLYDYEELPAGFILRPDKSMALDHAERLTAKKLMAKVDEAQFALGPGVFITEIKKLEKKLAKGDAKRDKGMFKGARKIYEKAGKSKKPLHAHLQGMVDARFEALDKKAMEAVEAAAALEGKSRSDALKRIAREMKDRAPGEAAEKALGEAAE